MTSISFYFFAGDFADVLTRFSEQRAQIYQTHNEVARLIHQLVETGLEVQINSFVTETQGVAEPMDGVTIKTLGARSYADGALLKSAVEQDRADMVVAHFADFELLDAVSATDKRAMAIFANSYNRRNAKAIWERRQVARRLNSDRFEWVSNHCIPATEHLAALGVERQKLIAWDVPHPFEPSSHAPKTLQAKDQYSMMYVGSIQEDKGVGDIIRAIALLRTRGLNLGCTFAGLGDLDGMQTLGRELGVVDALTFVGLIGNPTAFEHMVNSDVVVVPSRQRYTEGFPLTMFEAIASRTPIVCSDHPMFRLHMIDGMSASVFKGGDSASLAAAIERTLRDAALYFRLSAAADATWSSLKGPADWRSMLVHWAVDASPSSWMRQHALMPLP